MREVRQTRRARSTIWPGSNRYIHFTHFTAYFSLEPIPVKLTSYPIKPSFDIIVHLWYNHNILFSPFFCPVLQDLNANKGDRVVVDARAREEGAIAQGDEDDDEEEEEQQQVRGEIH